MKDIIYNSQLQNLHMDRANKNSMITVVVNMDSNMSPGSGAEMPKTYEIYKYKHGYNYIPQFWSLWDVEYSQSAYSGIRIRSYNTGGISAAGLTMLFYAQVDSEYVHLYFTYYKYSGGGAMAGTKVTFTGYVFANDLQEQDYTK